MSSEGLQEPVPAPVPHQALCRPPPRQPPLAASSTTVHASSQSPFTEQETDAAVKRDSHAQRHHPRHTRRRGFLQCTEHCGKHIRCHSPGRCSSHGPKVKQPERQRCVPRGAELWPLPGRPGLCFGNAGSSAWWRGCPPGLRGQEPPLSQLVSSDLHCPPRLTHDLLVITVRGPGLHSTDPSFRQGLQSHPPGPSRELATC